MSSNQATPPPVPSSGGGQVQKIIFIFAAILAVIWLFRSCGKENTEKEKGEEKPVAVMIVENGGGTTSHITPFSKKILLGFQIHCVEAIDVWVPNNQLPADGAWYLYDPTNGYTNLPPAKYSGDKNELVYKFRRHED